MVRIFLWVVLLGVSLYGQVSTIPSSIAITCETVGHVPTWDGSTFVCSEPPGASGGEANTASNTGSTGTGVFKGKSLLDLQFYKLASPDNLLTIDLSGTDFLRLTINQANFSLTGSQISDFADTVALTALTRANNLSDLQSASAARSNLGLGSVDNTADADKTVAVAVSANAATALATNPTNCSAGQIPLGITAAGEAEGCYTINATSITFTPVGDIAAVTVAAALAELDDEKQPLDDQLNEIAGLSCDEDEMLQVITGVWSCVTAPSGGAGTAGTMFCPDADSDNDTYTCSLQTIGLNGSTATNLLAYTTGLTVVFVAKTVNTGTATININGLGAKTITMESDSVLVDGILPVDTPRVLEYDGNTFRVLGSSAIFPDATNNSQKMLTSIDGVSPGYEDRIALPPDEQAVDANDEQVLPNSSNVSLTSDTSRTLCNASGVVTDGSWNGQWVVIHNASTSNTLTFSDKAVCTGSKLSLGGSNVAVGPGGGLTLTWYSPYWHRSDTPGSSSGGGLGDPGSNGLVKRTSLNTTTAAVAGTDYVVPAGNVATATALAANGSNCSAGSYSRGVDASGAAENCTVVTSSTIYAHQNSAAQVSASSDGVVPTIHYLPLSGTQSTNSSENARSTIIPVSGTLSRLYVLNGTSPQSATGSLTCFIRVNAATPSNTMTVVYENADGANAVKTDTSNTVAVSAGDKVTLRCENLATTAATAISSFSVVLTF